MLAFLHPGDCSVLYFSSLGCILICYLVILVMEDRNTGISKYLSCQGFLVLVMIATPIMCMSKMVPRTIKDISAKQEKTTRLLELLSNLGLAGVQ